MLSFFSFMVCGLCFTWNVSYTLKLWLNATPRNQATVLVAFDWMQLFWLLLVDHTKGRSPQKGHLWPRNYTPCVQLCQEFLPRFFKKFFLHTVPTIPKLCLLLYCIAWDKSRAILNCRLFCFFAENDFESDFEIESENEFKFKIGFESDFESDFESENVSPLARSRVTWNMKHKYNHKKPIYGQKIIPPRFSFVKNFFQKSFWRICRPSPKKRPLRRSFLPSYSIGLFGTETRLVSSA